eukprot:4989213-Amphidinium_carterae.1
MPTKEQRFLSAKGVGKRSNAVSGLLSIAHVLLPGVAQDEAYMVVSGKVRYTIDPDSMLVQDKVVDYVQERSWLCEVHYHFHANGCDEWMAPKMQHDQAMV